MLSANVCEGFISSCFGECGTFFFGAFGLLFGALSVWEVLALLVYTLSYRAWVTSVCLLLDTPFGRRSVGALSFVTFG